MFSFKELFKVSSIFYKKMRDPFETKIIFGNKFLFLFHQGIENLVRFLIYRLKIPKSIKVTSLLKL